MKSHSLRLGSRHLQQIIYKAAVLGARIGTSLDYLRVIDEKHVAGGVGLNKILTVLGGRSENLAEYVVCLKLLEYALAAFVIYARKMCLAVQHDPYLVNFIRIVHNYLAVEEYFRDGGETMKHVLFFFIRYVLEN